jgi:aerobic carbon-monoxide dehydrogenase large subunit
VKYKSRWSSEHRIVSSQVLTTATTPELVQEVEETQRVIGRSLKRKEDLRVLTGKTRYVDDIKFANLLHSAVLRSTYAHARITKLDTTGAKQSAGVRAVFTFKDLPEKSRYFSGAETKDGLKLDRPVLANDEVCFVGEPIVFVVADTRYQAEDALENIKVDFEPLPVIIDPEFALKDESPKSHSGMKTNLAVVDTVTVGDVDSAFSKAAKVVKLDLLNQRLSPAPMEPRSVIANFDSGTQMLNVWISTQGPFQTRSDLAKFFDFPENRVRVYAPDVGGGFGAKVSLYPEDVLVSWASVTIGKPIKWIETRTENFLSMTHGRGQLQHVELASTDNGRILGLKVRIVGDSGAYLTGGSSDATFTLRMCPGQYMIPAYKGEALVVLTNKITHEAYRGASRPEATYLIERAIDELSRELGIDSAEVRLRNFVPKEDFPFKTAGNLTYDTGDYSMNLQRALDLSKYDKWREEQRRARASGRLIGIGLVTYVEICAFGPDFPQTGAVSVSQTGKVTVITGNSPHGQGHETPLAQIVAEKLGLSVDDIVVVYGDTMMLPWGTFTAGSRSAALGGTAVLNATEKIKEKMSKIASAVLEIPEEDLYFSEGQIISRSRKSDDPKKNVSFTKIADLAYRPTKLPKGIESVLFAFSSFAPPNYTYPFGTHIAVIEIERETGKLRILDYTSVDDCGKVINPMIVEGQIHGGVVQGLGQALLEDVNYDEGGQLLSSSFMDYQIPLAEDIPNIHSYRTETPSDSNPLGIKGIGEAGTIAGTPVIAIAVRDALSQYGTRVEKMPFSLEYTWSLAKGNSKN